jgi:hypothetical protein
LGAANHRAQPPSHSDTRHSLTNQKIINERFLIADIPSVGKVKLSTCLK